MISETSGNSSSSTRMTQTTMPPDQGFLCDCGKPATIRQAWTDANPGRRFYSCGAAWRSVCDFFQWRDLEKPHGWQKTALLEARDVIRAQKETIKLLQEAAKEEPKTEADIPKEEGGSSIEKLEKENIILRSELQASHQAEQTLRHFVLISWVGFICVVATVVHGLR
ncbi:Zinc finger GRF-type [Arabidopsis thaliana x Arabidopsis arenosa]|uniref:Zinc finger GRF-type n=1 Tax=Arabidopsis thaliana x Arabidopsis arenosa TaxID=1240361 RepID=A0A8T1ZIF5_9BRAS|nr:Zinc finger GRF-type [Arabidopsis thaliana x Arabidopsis arenosa]